jgi:hypothetical protein
VAAIRETFAGFYMEETRLLHSVSGGKGRTARELMICWRRLSAPLWTLMLTSAADTPD